MRTLIFTLCLSVSIPALCQYQLEWEQYYSADSTSISYSLDMKMDQTGSTYVYGAAEDSSGSAEGIVIKYDPAGNTMWTWTNPDGAFYGKMALDHIGNLYVVDGIPSLTNDIDIVVYRLNNLGQLTWTASYQGMGGSGDQPGDLFVDNNLNVYVTGHILSPVASSRDMVTVKFDSAGNEEWAVIYDYNSGDLDQGHAIAVDSSGNVYVTGYSPDSAGIGSILLKYDDQGQLIWERRASTDAVGMQLEFNSAGEIIIMGTALESTAYDFYCVAFDANGQELWEVLYNAQASMPVNRDDLPASMAIDESDNVYITGTQFDANISITDILTIKIEPGGNLAWTKSFDYMNGRDNGVVVRVGSNGNIYVAGHGVDTIKYSQVMLFLIYDSLGNLLWDEQYLSDSANLNTYAVGMELDPFDNIVASGRIDSQLESELLTIKFSQLALGIDGVDPVVKSRVYPNPFRTRAMLTFSNSEQRRLTLELYDLNGSLILRKADIQESAVELDGSSFPSGTYVYKLSVQGSIIDSGKLVIY